MFRVDERSRPWLHPAPMQNQLSTTRADTATDRLVARGVALTLLSLTGVAALAWSPRFFYAFSDVKSCVPGMGLVLLPGALFAWAGFARRRPTPGQTVFGVAAVTLVAWSGCSLGWATNPFESEKGLAFYGGCAGIGLAAATLVDANALATRLAWLLAAILYLVGTYGFLQAGDLDPFLRGTVEGFSFQMQRLYPGSTFGNANSASQFVAPAAVLVLGVAAAASAPWRAACLAGAAFAGAAFVVVTQSRGGLLSLAAGAVPLSVTIVRRAAASDRGRAKRWAAGLAAAVLLLAVETQFSGTAARFVATTREARKPSSTSYRYFIWRDTLRLAEAHPWTGVGVWNFDVAIPAHASEQLLAQQDNEFASDRINRVHNDYLNFAVDLGLPGLALFLVLAAAVGAAARKLWRGGRLAGAGLAAALVSVGINALVDFPLNSPASAVLAWLLAGLAVGGGGGRAGCHWPRRSVGACVAAGMILCFAGMVPWFRYLESERLVRRGDAVMAAARFGQAADVLRQATDVAPRNREAYAVLTVALRKSGDFAAAADAARRWVALEPGFSAAHNALGYALVSAGNNEGALEAFLAARHLAPTNVAATVNAANVLYLSGENRKAFELYADARRRSPDFARDSLRNFADAAFESGETTAARELMGEYLAKSPDDTEIAAKLARIGR